MTAGSAVAAAVPLPAVAARATPVVVPHTLNVWATAMARAGNPISHTTLSQALKVTPDQAGVLMSRLQAAGTIGVPNAAGIARAMSQPSVPGWPKTESMKAQFERLARKSREFLSEPDGPDLTPSDDDPGPPEALAEARSTE